jgi:hypothetical protein
MTIGCRSLWLLTLFVVPLVAALACGDDGAAPPASPTPTPAASPTPTAGPSPVVTGTPLTGLPEKFPVYVNAELVESETFDSDRLVAEFETDDSRQEVADFYSDALNEDPWIVLAITEPSGQDATLVAFGSLDDPNLSATVAIRRPTADADKTEIVVEFVLPGGALLTPTPIGD